MTSVSLALLVSVSAAAVPDAGGQLDAEIIRREIRGHHLRTWGCYERNLAADSVTDFRVVLTFTISPAGQVDGVEARSSISAPDVESCLVAEAKTWRFPKPKGGPVPVRYPFIFKADED